MRVTDAAKVDPNYRRWRKANALLAAIERQLDWQYTHARHKLTLKHYLRATHASAEINQYLQTGEPSEETPAGEINSSLSSREMINQPSKQTLRYIFEGLQEPSSTQLDAYKLALIETMNEKGRLQRIAQHKILLMYEIAKAAHDNQYMIFQTLTVQPGSYNKVFSEGSTEFQQYIRKVTRLANGEHRYFACVEEGGKFGRLHIHLIHIMNNRPKGAQDPNKGRPRCNYLELACMKNLWPHGNSVPLLVRYSLIDRWSQDGYRWPIDVNTGKEKNFSSPLALATYMSKYITKSQSHPERADYLWRIRKTQNLGLAILNELLSKLTMQDLLNIATNDALNPKLNNLQIPPSLLRLQALRNYRDRLSKEAGQSLITMAKNIEPREQPLRHSLGSTQTSPTHSLQNTIATRINDTDAEASFEETAQRLYAEAELIDERYFRNPSINYGTATTRDFLY